MPDLKVDEIVTKVHDLLKADAKTKAITWHLGRWTLLDVQSFPAGGVSLAPGILMEPATVPTGVGADVPVRITLEMQSHTGVAEAERVVQDWVSKVLDVLFTTKQLDLASFATKPYLLSMAVPEMESNGEAQIPYATADLVAIYRVRM